MVLLNYLYIFQWNRLRLRLTDEVPLAVCDEACDISLFLFECQIQLKETNLFFVFYNLLFLDVISI